MIGPRYRLPAWVVGALAAVAVVAPLSVARAQTSPPPSAPVVTVQAPAYVAGNVTFTGVAVDCATGQPATRVAVYNESPDPAGGSYVADVSMDRDLNLGSVCPGRSGMARIGYTLIYNTRLFDEGLRPLRFTAEFPNGASGTASFTLLVENHPPYEVICNDIIVSRC